MNDKLLNMAGLAVRAGKTTFGVFMTEKAINEGRVNLVIAAEDIGSSNRRRIEGKCRSAEVKLIYYSEKSLLSHAVGKKDVPVVGICDENLASAIVKIYGGATE